MGKGKPELALFAGGGSGGGGGGSGGGVLLIQCTYNDGTQTASDGTTFGDIVDAMSSGTFVMVSYTSRYSDVDDTVIEAPKVTIITSVINDPVYDIDIQSNGFEAMGSATDIFSFTES